MKNAETNPPTLASDHTTQANAAVRFDRATRLMATPQSRRHIVAGLASGIMAALFISRDRAQAAACDAGAGPCTADGDCCSGICDRHLYRCVTRPSVCTGWCPAPAVPGHGCVDPVGPPSSVIVSGVPEPPGAMVSPRPPVAAPPANAAPKANPSCQDVPDFPGSPSSPGMTAATDAKDEARASTTPHPFASWDY